jgi:hypothetical protein
MLRDYSITSPSLDGILQHESIVYEGIKRPTEIIRAFDRPRSDRPAAGKTDKPAGDKAASDQIHDLCDPENRKILNNYWNDLYGLFMRKLSQFITEAEVKPDEEVRLQAMLQELVKVKGLLAVPAGEGEKT